MGTYTKNSFEDPLKEKKVASSKNLMGGSGVGVNSMPRGGGGGTE